MNLLKRFWRFLWTKPNADSIDKPSSWYKYECMKFDNKLLDRFTGAETAERGIHLDGVFCPFDPPTHEYDTDLGPVNK